MSGRALITVATGVLAVMTLCAGALSGLGGTGSTCLAPAATALDADTGYSAEQLRHAATIVTVGRTRAVPPRGWVIAVATAVQESRLRNLPGGPDDSVGVFQQRPSQGWGGRAQLLDPGYAADRFYQRLQQVPGWQRLPLTEAAQAVQRSAYPHAYARWETDAQRIVAHVAGPAACAGPAIGVLGWVRPVTAPVGSGFRTTGRPGHDGVDLITARGTPVVAAAAGTVTRVRCNAVHAATGRPWGCDRDGDPALTRGCGWYLEVTHTGQLVSRYCHLLTRPAVAEGQRVAAGQPIGRVGSSGHSSGPHLHFEIHLGDPTSATAVDPVSFMAAHDAPLNANDREPSAGRNDGHNESRRPQAIRRQTL